MSSTRMVNGVLGIPLTTPTATAVFAILTVIGLIVLLLRRYRVWFAHGVPLAVTAALGSTVVAGS
ncbi:hypothetical protein [Rhodococcus pyridinivorans]|uniref:hypothetical protein n=1 Tax=Rhodococcus pyridinivorans TaxID=103816 RepID=UPI001E371131|nr:hypothetical protein [Rhodococcus pyridinivorans]MCD2140565.1 hypothetical protein [Rhodococcus pyridinivorans]